MLQMCIMTRQLYVGKCWSGTCEQRASNSFKIGECSDGDVAAPGECPDGNYQTAGISGGSVYKQNIRPGNYRDFSNGDDNPLHHVLDEHNPSDRMVDFACPGNSGNTDAQEQYCMDWAIPSGGPVIRVPHSPLWLHGCRVYLAGY